MTGDVSYNIALLGISSIAETSIGTVACCLPVLPLFFQSVINPKFHTIATSTFWSKSRSISRSTPKHSNPDSTSNASSGLPQNQVLGKYRTLDSHELQSLSTKEIGIGRKFGDNSNPELAGSTEGIRVTKEFDIDNSPAMSRRELELEARRKIVPRSLAAWNDESAVWWYTEQAHCELRSHI